MRRNSLGYGFFSAAALLAATPCQAVEHSVWDGGSGIWDKHVLKWNGGGKWQNNVNATFGGTPGIRSPSSRMART